VGLRGGFDVLKERYIAVWKKYKFWGSRAR
jgi:hypothetical protein